MAGADAEAPPHAACCHPQVYLGQVDIPLGFLRQPSAGMHELSLELKLDSAPAGSISVGIDFVQAFLDSKGRMRMWPLYLASAKDLDDIVTTLHDCAKAMVDSIAIELKNKGITLLSRKKLINVPYLVARALVNACKAPSFPNLVASKCAPMLLWRCSTERA